MKKSEIILQVKKEDGVSRVQRKVAAINMAEAAMDDRSHIVNNIMKCIFCGQCMRNCPSGAITVDRRSRTWRINLEACVNCGTCIDNCPRKCLSLGCYLGNPSEITMKGSRPPVRRRPSTFAPAEKEGPLPSPVQAAKPEAPAEKVNGCFFKSMAQVRNGKIISLNAETIGCGGGKFYSGFTDMPEHVPGFVSLKEKYKKTPDMVVDFIQELQVPKAENAYLHFARIDKIGSFDKVEGILFLATPDMLAGLTTWAFFDSNATDAVSAPFGSGCCSVVTQAILENRKQGKRTFLGFFDPSVRPHFEAELLSFTIPMSRFKEMYHTMRESCLFDTHAWSKL